MLKIKLDNLNFSYGKNTPKVFNNFKHTFEANNTYLVSGKNGSGKSTLLKIISGIIDSGNVSYSGFTKFKAPICSYFNQNLGLYEEMSVKENINFFKNLLNSNYDENINELIEKFKLKKFLHKKIFELSSGQKVKVALILKLFFKPTILLLDEPANNLDKESKTILNEIILDLIKHHKNEQLIILVDHLEMFKDIVSQEIEL